MLSAEQIEACANDNALFDLLGAEMTAHLGADEGGDLDLFLKRTSQTPVGLRAMAATYQLDVSLALDDLGWHFANWHHRGYCEETRWALSELGAHQHAAIFAEAYEKVQPYWERIGELCRRDFRDFVERYRGSELDALMFPPTKSMWDLEESGSRLFGFWLSYAREYPERVCG